MPVYSYAIGDPSCTTPQIPPASANPNPRNASVAIQSGTQKYTSIKSPALAIYVAPKEGVPVDAAALAREGCVTAFKTVVPSSRIVRLPGAAHHVFMTNEADVLKEIRDFVATLKQ